MKQYQILLCEAMKLSTPASGVLPQDTAGWSAPAMSRADDRCYSRALAFFLIILTIVRLISLGFSNVDLFYDESQYWSWAQDPSLGYFSKPPLLAWLLTGWTFLFGSSEWAVRAPAALIHGGTCFMIFMIARHLYDGRTGFLAAIAAALAPGIVFSCRIISTDVPLLFFWSVATFAYLKLLAGPSRLYGLLFGVSLGLGLLSKYAMIYFVTGMLVATFACPDSRSALRNPAIWSAMLLATVIVAPNVAWNYQHGFATFAHTGGLVLDEPFQPSLTRAVEFLASQFGVIGPLAFPIAFLAAISFNSKDLTGSDRLMLAFFVTPVVAVTIFAVYSRAYPNWASPSIVPALVVSTAIVLRRGWRRLFWASLAAGAIFQIVLLITDVVAYQLPSIAHFSNPYRRVLGWRDYAENVEELAERLHASTIVSDNRRAFSTLRYYLRRSPQPVFSWRWNNEPAFDFLHGLSHDALEPILFVTNCGNSRRLDKYFAGVRELGVQPDFNRKSLRRFFAFELTAPRSPVGPLESC
jgi:hypothetical protein